MFDEVSHAMSKLTTQTYSTSFSHGIRFLAKRFHTPIYNIYGFVRFADEIVDSFHAYDKETLLIEFRNDTNQAIERKISLNPILNSFQETFHKYNIPYDLVSTFLDSMEMDLKQITFSQDLYNKYILGSAEVVGLMCLRVFCEGDEIKYEELKPYAMKLGSAFQKVNFLRDINMDSIQLGRMYFPGVDFSSFNDSDKAKIELEIAEEFRVAYLGILKLPSGSQIGVLLAYRYYVKLFKRIQRLSAMRIQKERIRVPDWQKWLMMFQFYLYSPNKFYSK